MQIGPSCYQPAPARQISVEGLWFPYQNNLLIARQQEVYAGSPEDLVETEYGDTATGRRLFTMPPMDQSSWIELDIRPVGTIFNNPVEWGEPTVPNVSTGVKWTPARARITWTEQGGSMQSIDVDIGAGTNFAVPPTNQVWVDLLVPDPDGLEQVIIPPTIPFENLSQVKYFTTVSCKATCVSSPGANRACLTRLLYLGNDALPFGVRSQVTTVPRGTKSVEVFVGQSGAGGPGSDDSISPDALLLRWEPISALGRPPSNTFPSALPDLFLDVFPSARFQLRGTSSDRPQWQTGRVVYPGSLYDAIRSRLRIEQDKIILTFKFTLDV